MPRLKVLSSHTKKKHRAEASQSHTGNNQIRIRSAVSRINDLAKTWKARLGLWSPADSSGKIRCASDCSGYGSDLIALRLFGLQKRVDSVMTCESCGKKMMLHDAVAAACGIDTRKVSHYADICGRDNAAAPRADLYTAGYPCPSYSTLGKKRGVLDDRGFVSLQGLMYIAEKRPRAIILEQVAAILQKKHSKIFQFMQKILRELDYRFEIRVLNTKQFTIPHSRSRMYLIAVARESLVHELSFPPARSEHADLHAFLEKDKVGTEVLSLPFYEEKLGNRLFQKGYILDVGSSQRFQSVMPNLSPCLTKSRLKAAGYYIPKLRRRLTLAEAAQLQGVPPQILQAMEEAAKLHRLPKRSVDESLGDAMSVNVLMSVLRRALDACGLTKLGSGKDFWLQVPLGEASVNLSKKLFDKYKR